MSYSKSYLYLSKSSFSIFCTVYLEITQTCNSLKHFCLQKDIQNLKFSTCACSWSQDFIYIFHAKIIIDKAKKNKKKKHSSECNFIEKYCVMQFIARNKWVNYQCDDSSLYLWYTYLLIKMKKKLWKKIRPEQNLLKKKTTQVIFFLSRYMVSIEYKTNKLYIGKRCFFCHNEFLKNSTYI